MKNKTKILHPATMFLLLMLTVVFLSWILDVYELKVTHPGTGEVIKVQSLLSPEGIRWWLRHVVSNFTDFAPLGMVMVTLLGIGVAEHAGLINVCIRQGLKDRMNKSFVMILVILLGLVSNVIGDAGYIILIPIAAILFHSVGLHPIAGIITAYVSVSCGFSANLFLNTLDPLLARYTQEAAGLHQSNVGAFSNYYFMSISTFIIGGVIYWLTKKYLSPLLGAYEGKSSFNGYKQLSGKERRALYLSLLVGGFYVLIIAFATLSPWGILRGITGGITRSPFIAGTIFLLSFGIGLMGLVYGFASGRYRSDSDVIKGLSQPMSLLSVYFVIIFFASQMFACIEYSHLDKCFAVFSANLFSSLRVTGLSALLLFILFTAVINLIITSSTSKWVLISFIFVPMFAAMGITPEWTQCAYRIGDSTTNAISPFLFYLPLVLSYMLQYDKQSSYVSLLKYTWRYSFCIFLAWILLFVVWYLLKFPLGM
ncbi:MAG: AbgT family transporter [Bacteroides sp.]